jgi:hypothetical protein
VQKTLETAGVLLNLKVLSSKNYERSKFVSIDRYFFSVLAPDIFYNLKGHRLGFLKKCFIAASAQIPSNVRKNW